MSRRNRVFLGILAVLALGVGYLLYLVAGDLDSRYRESAEETMVDSAQVLAALVDVDPASGRLDVTRLRAAYGAAAARPM